MHYRNGREAKNGDKIVQLGGNGEVQGVGVLFDAEPGTSFCNGYIAPVHTAPQSACLCDCLHIEDVAQALKDADLHTRPTPDEHKARING